MRNQGLPIVIVTTLSLLGLNVASAEEPITPTEETTPATPSKPSTATPSPDAVPPPDDAVPPPAAVPPPTAAQPQANLCGPLAYSTTDRDATPGRGLRIGGGLLIGLGLVSIGVGAGVAGWATAHDPSANTSQRDLDNMVIAGAVTGGVGGAAFLMGIPMVVAGVRRGRVVHERPVAVAPSFHVPRGGGAMAGLGVKY